MPISFENAKVTTYGAPPDSTALIEEVIDQKLADLIYKALDAKNWREEFGIDPLDFGGGQFGLSIFLMLQDIPEKEVAKIRGIGRKRAAAIYEALRNAMEMEPGY